MLNFDRSSLLDNQTCVTFWLPCARLVTDMLGSLPIPSMDALADLEKTALASKPDTQARAELSHVTDNRGLDWMAFRLNTSSIAVRKSSFTKDRGEVHQIDCAECPKMLQMFAAVRHHVNECNMPSCTCSNSDMVLAYAAIRGQAYFPALGWKLFQQQRRCCERRQGLRRKLVEPRALSD